MICYDCSLSGRQVPAIGVCAACGAAACAECAYFGTQTIHLMEGFASAEINNVDTRVLNCARCADAVHANHPLEKGLAPR
jgi:hypothetical protein